MTDLEDLEAEETLDEFTEDEASEPDLAALIPDNAVAAVCALRRGMFDYRSSPASRIAAARDVLDIALSRVENENRPAPFQPMHWGELLMRYLINEKRVREARKREAALRNSLESTLLEGEKECLPNEENEEPKNQASNRTSAEVRLLAWFFGSSFSSLGRHSFSPSNNVDSREFRNAASRFLASRTRFSFIRYRIRSSPQCIGWSGAGRFSFSTQLSAMSRTSRAAAIRLAGEER